MTVEPDFMTSGPSEDWVIDWRHKSFPPAADGLAASSLADAGFTLLEDFSTPVAALSSSALAHNEEVMRRYCADHGVRHAPHGKTTMSPELITGQVAAGAWGITAATPWQARAMITMGVRRILIANEAVDRPGLTWLIERMRTDDVEVAVFADSVAVVHLLSDLVTAVDGAAPLPVLVEVGVRGGRAGVRTVSTGVEVGQAVAAAPGLTLIGVAGFEGVVGGGRDERTVAAVRRFLADIGAVGRALAEQRAFDPDRPVVLSAGGSLFFDLVAEELGRVAAGLPVDAEVVIRSGCYLTHDHGVYRDGSPLSGDDGLRPAMRVWARVLSTPETGLAIIDAGRRDISTDAGMPPVLLRRRGRDTVTLDPGDAVVDHVNDQHGFVHVAVPGSLDVGDLVALGVSHPCTTFDKWRAIPVVDDDDRVIGAVRTYF